MSKIRTSIVNKAVPSINKFKVNSMAGINKLKKFGSIGSSNFSIELSSVKTYGSKGTEEPRVGIYCFRIIDKKFVLNKLVTKKDEAIYNENLNVYSDYIEYSELIDDYNNSIPHGRLLYRKVGDEVVYALLTLDKWLNDSIYQQICKGFNLEGYDIRIIYADTIERIF